MNCTAIDFASTVPVKRGFQRRTRTASKHEHFMRGDESHGKCVRQMQTPWERRRSTPSKRKQIKRGDKSYHGKHILREGVRTCYRKRLIKTAVDRSRWSIRHSIIRARELGGISRIYLEYGGHIVVVVLAVILCAIWYGNAVSWSTHSKQLSISKTFVVAMTLYV